jgi:hypothetical protein
MGTPMELNQKLEKLNECDTNLPYRELFGKLMYLSVCTRPDISYACSKLGQFLNGYGADHFRAGKRVLRYLSGTSKWGLIFKKSSPMLKIYADADWASCTIDRKSFSGFVVKIGASTVNWEAKKQKVVATSSTEAEYYSIAEACKELIYVKNFLKDCHVKIENECIPIQNILTFAVTSLRI